MAIFTREQYEELLDITNGRKHFEEQVEYFSKLLNRLINKKIKKEL